MTSEISREVAELIGLIRIPSHSANPAARREAASYCVALLEASGFRTVLAGKEDAPTIIAELDGNGPGRLLFYNHYDVVPPGDPKTWARDPFGAEIEDGFLHGRGSSDHKASFIARLAAVRRLKEKGELPVGIVFFVEGEEEIGSPSVEAIIVEHRDRLAAQGGLYSGGARTEDGSMVVRAGCKGRCGLELRVRHGDRDNHSKWAAILPSATWRLIEALGSLRDPSSGEVLVEGFMDGVRGPDAADEEALRTLDFEAEAFLPSVGHRSLRKEAAADPLRSLMFEPTFNIAWMKSGSGGGTVLPGEASAMLDIRLVPGQDAAGMAAKVRAHLDMHGFGDVELRQSGGSDPDKCDLEDPVVRALRSACERVSRKVVVHPMGAGSGPRHLFRKHLGFSLVQDPGCSWQGSNDHGPNENIEVRHFDENRRVIEAFLADYGRLTGER